MRKNISIWVLLLSCVSLLAQDIDLNVISSGGDFATTGSGSLSWTMGEPISETIQDVNNKITQGFQQADKHEAKVILSGAILDPVVGEEEWMRDDLRNANYIPTTSPFPDAATTTAPVLAVTGQNAIVDWIWVTLRDQSNNTIVVESKSALLQRDGDIVETDGTTRIAFASKGFFYVSIEHRNHLGFMSATPRRIYPKVFYLNFQDGFINTYGSNALFQYSTSPTKWAMWTGDANDDKLVRFSGASNDSNGIKDIVVNDPGNILGLITFPVPGYADADMNMNGFSVFSGGGSDVNVIKDAILIHPGNILNFITYTIVQQLP